MAMFSQIGHINLVSYHICYAYLVPAYVLPTYLPFTYLCPTYLLLSTYYLPKLPIYLTTYIYYIYLSTYLLST
jgi:hypothetical protein